MDLILQARQGDKASLNQLAEVASVRVEQFIYRITLREDVSHDVAQETIIEMLKIFGKLRHVERFWYWLYGIARNKMLKHFRQDRRHNGASISDHENDLVGLDRDQTVAQVVTEELRQIVVQCIKQLHPRHRAILTLRCYEQMEYSDIAEHLGCTEFGARSLFYRAKKSLAKKLTSHGLGKGACLMALVLFGKLTSATEAQAAGISITAATLKVGPAASLAGMLMGHKVLVGLTAGALAVGTVAAPKIMDMAQGPAPTAPAARVMPTVRGAVPLNSRTMDIWYYYPEGPDGPVMIRSHNGRNQWCLLQNAQGNYVWDGDTIYINNFRAWADDMSLKTLPTDPASLAPAAADQATVQARGPALLVVSDCNEAGEAPVIRVSRNINVLQEDYFLPDWPSSIRVVDRRDVMHRRGWTYFRMRGTVNGHSVFGRGQIPFVYSMYRQHSPWLELRVGESERITDTIRGAQQRDVRSSSVRRYEPGSFFVGLARPWIGLHTVDVIRRDAIRAGLAVETRLQDDQTALITMQYDDGHIRYTVDLMEDVVTRIDIERHNEPVGAIEFEYFQELPETTRDFAPPRLSRASRSQLPEGYFWLVELAKDAGRP